ncbi:MAG: hypothetical protein AABZ07_01840, partial [Nitrospirota bacterium]
MMRNARLALAVLLLAQSIPASAGMMSGLSGMMSGLTDLKKPNIKIGQLALHPYYGLTLSYDDNIYRVPPD